MMPEERGGVRPNEMKNPGDPPKGGSGVIDSGPKIFYECVICPRKVKAPTVYSVEVFCMVCGTFMRPKM